jgi:predicted acylesterase/phospholipase RssA
MTDLQHAEAESKKSLILAGGGMRVAYQAGVLMALEEAGIHFDHVDGTSGGIFNTGMLASGIKPIEMAEKWRSLKLSGFVSAGSAKSYLKPFKTQGFADAENIRKKVFPQLGINLFKINHQADFEATFNVCNFSTKSVVSIPSKSVSEDHLIAGVSLPIFMPAINIQGTWYTDAVWIKDANLMEAVRRGSKELWLVWAIGNSPTYLGGAFNQYVHMIEMSANGALLEEYKQISLLNQLGAISQTDYKPIKLFVIKSRISLPLDPDFFFNKVNARELINMGYAHAKNYLENLNPNGDHMVEKTTENEEPDYLYSFRAIFSGDIDWESTQTKIAYALYFRIAEFKNSFDIESYSSLHFVGKSSEVTGYHSRHSFTRANTGNTLEIETLIQIENKIHKIQVSTVLTNAWELLCGLNFKEITFRIWDENNKLIAEKVLYQSIFNRIKAMYYSSLKTSLGTRIGIKKRVSIIKKFINYGI